MEGEGGESIVCMLKENCYIIDLVCIIYKLYEIKKKKKESKNKIYW